MSVFNWPKTSLDTIFSINTDKNFFMGTAYGITKLGHKRDFSEYEINKDFIKEVPKGYTDIFLFQRVEMFDESGNNIFTNFDYLEKADDYYFLLIPQPTFRDKFYWVYLGTHTYPKFENIDRTKLEQVRLAAQTYAKENKTQTLIANRIFRNSWY